MIRIIGGIIIILASTLLGMIFSLETSQKLNTLYEIQKILIMLKGEITYNKAPAADAFLNLSEHVKEPFGSFFQKTGQELNQGFGKTIETVWYECCDSELKGLAITQEDKQAFRELGACMGYLDAEMQISSITLYSEKLDMRIRESTQGMKEKQKIFKIMGIMGGIFIVLLIA